MAYIAGRISECFKDNIFVIWSEDDAEKLIVRCRVLSTQYKHDGVSEVEEEDVFLRQLENTMLSSVSLRGVDNINRVFLEHDKVTTTEDGSIQANRQKEWILETDGANFKAAMCIDGVDFARTSFLRGRFYIRDDSPSGGR